MREILSRRSIRRYSPEEVSDANAKKLLAVDIEKLFIEAQYLGLGAVWLGIYSMEKWMDGIKRLFDLPQHIVPFAVVSVGHPAEEKKPGNRYIEKKIHHNGW